MRIYSSIRRVAKAAAVGTVFAVLPVTIALANWGPTRATFTWANPATYITFDSITDNPQVGDERPFLSGKVTSASGDVVDNIHVSDNDEVTLRVFYHNDAAQNLNLVATNTRVKVFLPRTESADTFATATISSDNSNPGVVSDTVNFNGDRPFTLEYIKGSAHISNNGNANGATLSDDIVTNTGALIGYNALDGRIPGCSQFSGYVTLKVKVHMQSPPTPVTYTANASATATASASAKAECPTGQTGSSAEASASATATASASATSTVSQADAQAKAQAAANAQAQAEAQANAQAAADAKAKASVKCATPTVTTNTPPQVKGVTTLPNTGAGDVFGLFAGASGLGAAGHFVTRRFRRR